MRKYRAQFVGVFITLPVLLLSSNFGHLMFSRPMANMPRYSCQTSCKTSQTPAYTVNKVDEVSVDKDIEPQPAEPYYLAIIGFGWSVVVLLSVYLLRHLHWRPPNIIKLNAAYRF